MTKIFAFTGALCLALTLVASDAGAIRKRVDKSNSTAGFMRSGEARSAVKSVPSPTRLMPSTTQTQTQATPKH
jgi:hypothetical protein